MDKTQIVTLQMKQQQQSLFLILSIYNWNGLVFKCATELTYVVAVLVCKDVLQKW